MRQNKRYYRAAVLVIITIPPWNVAMHFQTVCCVYNRHISRFWFSSFFNGGGGGLGKIRYQHKMSPFPLDPSLTIFPCWLRPIAVHRTRRRIDSLWGTHVQTSRPPPFPPAAALFPRTAQRLALGGLRAVGSGQLAPPSKTS